MAEGLIVWLNGYPGVGKLTLARALAPRIGARVLDNHALLNPASALFDRGTVPFLRLRQEIRRTVFSALLEAPAGLHLILTDAQGTDPQGRAAWAEVERLAQTRGDRLEPVIVDCAEAENRRRLALPSRAGTGKLTDVAVLDRLRTDAPLLEPGGAHRIDLTRRAPDAAAERLAARLGLGDGR